MYAKSNLVAAARHIAGFNVVKCEFDLVHSVASAVAHIYNGGNRAFIYAKYGITLLRLSGSLSQVNSGSESSASVPFP